MRGVGIERSFLSVKNKVGQLGKEGIGSAEEGYTIFLRKQREDFLQQSENGTVTGDSSRSQIVGRCDGMVIVLVGTILGKESGF